MGIKSKTRIIIGILLLTLLWFITCETSLAEDPAIITFDGTPTYTHTRTITVGDTIRGYSYKITVSIKNTGTVASQAMSVNLSDEEGYSLIYPSSITLEPGETETVTFNWSTSLVRDQNVQINFFPSDLNADRDQYNTGSTILNIVIPDSGTTQKTPGFELCIIIIALLALVTLSKYKKDRK